jgi:tRNA G18 (ribose-2'-O)-methylase SpoU
MSKSVKKAAKTNVVEAAVETPVVEIQTIEEAVANEPVEETAPVEEAPAKILGRKVNPLSARQQKLTRIAEMKEQGVVVKRGRTSNPTSKNQLKKQRFEALRAEGFEVKRGRPKMVKEESAAE